MNISTARMIQGLGGVIDFTLSGSVFQGTEALVAAVSTGGTAAALLTLTPQWTPGQAAGQYGRAYATYTSAQSAGLAPGFYVVVMSLADSSAGLAYAMLEVVAGAGQSPTYDWLVTPAEVIGLVPDLADVTKLADLPRLCGAASGLIRRYCNRWFTRRVVAKEFAPSYSGEVMLDEIPINGVVRVATGRQNALRIEGPASAQVKTVRFASAGDYGAGQVFTGLTLYSVASGVSTTTTLTFAADQTLESLATAIAGVSGWSADPTTYGQWPVTELVGGEVGQGAGSAGGAWLDVYAEDATLSRLDQDTGMLTLSTFGASSWDSPAWGPDWRVWSDGRRGVGRVKVTYDAGFTDIPSEVVTAAATTVQAMFSGFAVDNAIKSESADSYSYTLRDAMQAIPDTARQMLAGYRIVNA